MNPGDIYYADFEPAGRRPVIVVTRSGLNRGDRIVVVPCTTAKFETRKDAPNCVPFFPGRFGFTENSIAQFEAINVLYKSDIESATGPIGILDEEALHNVIRAVGYALDAECEPA